MTVEDAANDTAWRETATYRWMMLNLDGSERRVSLMRHLLTYSDTPTYIGSGELLEHLPWCVKPEERVMTTWEDTPDSPINYVHNARGEGADQRGASTQKLTTMFTNGTADPHWRVVFVRDFASGSDVDALHLSTSVHPVPVTVISPHAVGARRYGRLSFATRMLSDAIRRGLPVLPTEPHEVEPFFYTESLPLPPEPPYDPMRDSDVIEEGITKGTALRMDTLYDYQLLDAIRDGVQRWLDNNNDTVREAITDALKKL